jgi:hypothetical protein
MQEEKPQNKGLFGVFAKDRIAENEKKISSD